MGIKKEEGQQQDFSNNETDGPTLGDVFQEQVGGNDDFTNNGPGVGAGGGSKKGFSFHTAMGFGPISQINGSDVYSKLKEALFENYKHITDKNIEINIIDLDNINEPSLKYSTIIIAVKDKSKPEAGINAYLLILEATGDKLTPVIENINGKQIERLRTPSHAFDGELKKRAIRKILKVTGTGNVKIIGATVVPDTFNPEDKFGVHRIALNAGLACYTDFAIMDSNFVDIDLTTIERDGSLLINTAYAKQELEDAVGNKMRSDVLINFESRKDQRDYRASVNSGDKEVKISELSGFIDLLWSPAGDQAYNPYAPQQPTLTQKYAARLVITNLTSNVPYTLRSLLLNIGTALAIQDNNGWIQTFKPTSESKEIDLHDIGALNIDANMTNEASGYGTRINTKGDSFKLEDLGQLVGALIKPRLVVSVDCPIVAPQSWYLDDLSTASIPNRNSEAKYKEIYDAANALTGGKFSMYFNVGTPIFENLEDYVHNGYWTDNNGHVRDIRDIDYLAVCNLIGERNPQFIREWSDTFLDLSIPILERLETRKRMINSLTYDTAVFTGFSQRVTFTPAFLDALSMAIEATGVPVRINTPIAANEFSNRRATFLSDNLMQPGRSFATANVGYQNQNGGFGIDPRFWG